MPADRPNHSRRNGKPSAPMRTASISATTATRYSLTNGNRQYPMRTASISATAATRYSLTSSGPTNRSQRW